MDTFAAASAGRKGRARAGQESRGPTPKQAADSGLALVLIALLAHLFGGLAWAVPAAVVLVLLLMTVPRVFGPFARFWFGFSHLLGAVTSKIILTIVFFLLVTPVGLARRAAGKDTLRLGQWRSGSGSVFTVRDRAVEPADLENLF